MISNMGSPSMFTQDIQSRPKKDTSGSKYNNVNKPFSLKLTKLEFQHVEHKKSDAMFKFPSLKLKVSTF